MSWEKLVDRRDIDAIHICTPDNLHRDIALAAAQAGKHIFCEKPPALDATEARQMYERAEASGVKHMVNFVYRGVPAIQLARRLIRDGRLAIPYHFQGFYHQDFALSEDFPFAWRMDKGAAGAGTMADKGSHVVDLARFLVGELSEVSCRSASFVERRKDAKTGEERRATTNDAAVFTGTFENGALGVFETSNMSAGCRNAMYLELNGSKGSLRFNLERLNELEAFFAEDAEEIQGFRSIVVTQPVHRYVRHWWPPGHALDWEHAFVHSVYEFLQAIAEDRQPEPSFYDGMKCQQVVDALTEADRVKR
jgi:predicted dehydrogenase